MKSAEGQGMGVGCKQREKAGESSRAQVTIGLSSCVREFGLYPEKNGELF